ncbi:hypothetical protein [Aquitalea aquatica]|nr:hypothetical protein [Aquitalea magnusonii]
MGFFPHQAALLGSVFDGLSGLLDAMANSLAALFQVFTRAV